MDPAETAAAAAAAAVDCGGAPGMPYGWCPGNMADAGADRGIPGCGVTPSSERKMRELIALLRHCVSQQIYDKGCQGPRKPIAQ